MFTVGVCNRRTQKVPNQIYRKIVTLINGCKILKLLKCIFKSRDHREKFYSFIRLSLGCKSGSLVSRRVSTKVTGVPRVPVPVYSRS